MLFNNTKNYFVLKPALLLPHRSLFLTKVEDELCLYFDPTKIRSEHVHSFAREIVPYLVNDTDGRVVFRSTMDEDNVNKTVCLDMNDVVLDHILSYAFTEAFSDNKNLPEYFHTFVQQYGWIFKQISIDPVLCNEMLRLNFSPDTIRYLQHCPLYSTARAIVNKTPESVKQNIAANVLGLILTGEWTAMGLYNTIKRDGGYHKYLETLTHDEISDLFTQGESYE